MFMHKAKKKSPFEYHIAVYKNATFKVRCQNVSVFNEAEKYNFQVGLLIETL